MLYKLDPTNASIQLVSGDLYYLCFLDANNLIIQAESCEISGSNRIYIGFTDDKVITDYRDDNAFLTEYLGHHHCQTIEVCTPLEILRNRIAVRDLVKMTRGKDVSNETSPTIDGCICEFYDIEIKYDSDCGTPQCLEAIIPKSEQSININTVYFSTDMENFTKIDYTLGNRINVEPGRYYLFAIKDGIPCFAAQTIFTYNDETIITGLECYTEDSYRFNSPYWR